MITTEGRKRIEQYNNMKTYRILENILEELLEGK